MKRQFLLWLYSFQHKPKWLKRQIEFAYWADLLNIQEEKKKYQSKYDKKLEELEARLVKGINSIKESSYGHDSDTVMTKLTPEEANDKTIEMMKMYKIKDEEISNRLEFLGLKKSPEFSIDGSIKPEKGVKQNGKSTSSAPTLGVGTNAKRKTRKTNSAKSQKLSTT